jgi:hypothetical protein
MSTQGNTDRSPRTLSRREFLVLGGAGTGALAFGGLAARVAQGRERAGEAFSYGGSEVIVGWRKGHPLLSIDGEPVVVVDTNGTYRAAGYAFDWASTPKGLAKKMIDNRNLLKKGR